MNISMMEWFAAQPVVVGLGWALVHFIWQASLIGALCAVLLMLTQRFSAQARYLIACSGLLLMVMAPVITFGLEFASADRTSAVNETVSSLNGAVNHPTIVSDRAKSPATEGDPLASNAAKVPATDQGLPGEAASVPFWSRNWLQQLKRGLPVWVMAWMVCVLILAIRMIMGLARVARWKQEAAEIQGEKIVAAFKRLTHLMNIRHVRLLQSAGGKVPAVIGWLRPVVLIPTSLISGLTTLELETILAHELAHVRRHDYLINLLQNVVETILFYHPAVWWLSNRIRIEREHCCDDEAVRICGDRVAFIRALARMEQMRCEKEQFAIAANGGSLIGRLRRLAGDQPQGAGPWWPAGVLTLAILLLVFAGLSIPQALSATPNAIPRMVEELNEIQPDLQTTAKSDEDFPMSKVEAKQVDTKTGFEKRVFAEINLSSIRNGKSKKSSLAMMYSNVLGYTFIPEKVARELNATELGTIDFGDSAPARANRSGQQWNGLKAAAPAPKADSKKTIHVHDVTEPVGDQTVVPYENETIWVPGHLGFYGMNQVKQHVFKIVRIDSVDLGIGPAFGPVNALVLNNANSDFGVLGSDWARLVRGNNGETLWHFAADGSLHLMGPPKPAYSLTQPEPKQDPASPLKSTEKETSKQSILKVESHGTGFVDPQNARPDVKVLKTLNYNLDRRQSTDWIELRSAKVPIDEGLEHGNLAVYMTLFNDIVVVDRESRKPVWDLDWNKGTPFWQTISIVEMESGQGKQTAIELFAPHKGELIYRYYALENGDAMPVPSRTRPDETAQVRPTDANTVPEGSDDVPEFQVAEKTGDDITSAYVHASPIGRSATEMLKHFSIGNRAMRPPWKGRVNNMETIVSAFPRYLLANAMDADEVTFNLPEGSGARVEFNGKQVAIEAGKNSTAVVVTHGNVKLLDSGGVVRATASADGGAEQLVAHCRLDADEVVMVIKAQRLKPDPNFPPPVMVKMNLETGAPADESEPPHGAIRYSIVPEDKQGKKPARMKMHWHYDLARLAKEAEAEQNNKVDDDRESDQQESGSEATSSEPSKTDSGSNQQVNRRPWIAQGRVTDVEGQPIPGATIRAHCGVGSLRQSGAATSDDQGKYVLSFGPGMWSSNPEFVQAATISIHLDGHFEKNLHRQGDLVAAMKMPDGDIGWGKTVDQLFLPGKPKKIDFVMVPSTSLRGMVSQSGKPAAGFRVSLTGDELPPSSSVVAAGKTNERGEFEFQDLPTGFKFQLMVEPPVAESPWLAWASPCFTFVEGSTNDTHLEYSIDGHPVDFSCQRLQVILDGEGVNWKQALKTAANTKLDLQWNGLSTDSTVRASDATIEIGQ